MSQDYFKSRADAVLKEPNLANNPRGTAMRLLEIAFSAAQLTGMDMPDDLDSDVSFVDDEGRHSKLTNEFLVENMKAMIAAYQQDHDIGEDVSDIINSLFDRISLHFAVPVLAGDCGYDELVTVLDSRQPGD